MAGGGRGALGRRALSGWRAASAELAFAFALAQLGAGRRLRITPAQWTTARLAHRGSPPLCGADCRPRRSAWTRRRRRRCASRSPPTRSWRPRPRAAAPHGPLPSSILLGPRRLLWGPSVGCLYDHPSSEKGVGVEGVSKGMLMPMGPCMPDPPSHEGAEGRGHGSVERSSPSRWRAQLRTRITQATNTEHGFPVGEIHERLTPPTSDRSTGVACARRGKWVSFGIPRLRADAQGEGFDENSAGLGGSRCRGSRLKFGPICSRSARSERESSGLL